MILNAWIIILISLLSGLTTLIGLGIAFKIKKNTKLISAGIGFSAGIMITISFLELLPEATFATSSIIALSAFIVGFVTLLILHYVIPHTQFVHEGHGNKKCKTLFTCAMMVAIGMILHDFPEGFAMATSFKYATKLGWLVAISIAVHNIPEAFAVAMPLTMTRNKAFIIKTEIFAALAGPVGAIIGLSTVTLAPMLTPIMLAFAAGAMIFVSLDELLPLARQYKKMQYFIFGIGISLFVFLALELFL